MSTVERFQDYCGFLQLHYRQSSPTILLPLCLTTQRLLYRYCTSTHQLPWVLIDTNYTERWMVYGVDRVEYMSKLRLGRLREINKTIAGYLELRDSAVQTQVRFIDLHYHQPFVTSSGLRAHDYQRLLGLCLRVEHINSLCQPPPVQVLSELDRLQQAIITSIPMTNSLNLSAFKPNEYLLWLMRVVSLVSGEKQNWEEFYRNVQMMVCGWSIILSQPINSPVIGRLLNRLLLCQIRPWTQTIIRHMYAYPGAVRSSQVARDLSMEPAHVESTLELMEAAGVVKREAVSARELGEKGVKVARVAKGAAGDKRVKQGQGNWWYGVDMDLAALMEVEEGGGEVGGLGWWAGGGV